MKLFKGRWPPWRRRGRLPSPGLTACTRGSTHDGGSLRRSPDLTNWSLAEALARSRAAGSCRRKSGHPETTGWRNSSGIRPRSTGWRLDRFLQTCWNKNQLAAWKFNIMKNLKLWRKLGFIRCKSNTRRQHSSRMKNVSFCRIKN